MMMGVGYTVSPSCTYAPRIICSAVGGRMLLPLRVAATGEGGCRISGFGPDSSLYEWRLLGTFEDEWGMVEGGRVTGSKA